jgi:hypothetical protein
VNREKKHKRMGKVKKGKSTHLLGEDTASQAGQVPKKKKVGMSHPKKRVTHRKRGPGNGEKSNLRQTVSREKEPKRGISTHLGETQASANSEQFDWSAKDGVKKNDLGDR